MYLSHYPVLLMAFANTLALTPLLQGLVQTMVWAYFGAKKMIGSLTVPYSS